MVSSFLTPGTVTKEGHLASLHLKRDLSLPVILSTSATNVQDQGYAEGVVTNTRFGSFPHSTIIGVPWGSQIKASKVDTGSRGRKGVQQSSRKRKAEALDDNDDVSEEEDDDVTPTQGAVAASSGFLHVLQPTPENWTTSLPHRTQVVYTPDYSYILHRIRARPGAVLIEAGSGSGSFTHAAARAVFAGYPRRSDQAEDEADAVKKGSSGKVYTYEFHAQRQRKVQAEMKDHGLDSVVRSFHRDVYRDGFLFKDEETAAESSPLAEAVFLDLPAPWEALPHLTRAPKSGGLSALDPSSAVHLCTFSPCIEQAQKTVSVLRRDGWLEIEMVEMQHKRLDVRREYTGLQYDGLRGANAVAADVDEAVAKLREVEKRAKDFHAGQNTPSLEEAKVVQTGIRPQDASKALFNSGRLIHRSEPELKTHTSYLVFAVLPRLWSEEDEERARSKWSTKVNITANVPKSQRQLKKEAKQRAKEQREAKQETTQTSTKEEDLKALP